jgi:hypothetical protein
MFIKVFLQKKLYIFFINLVTNCLIEQKKLRFQKLYNRMLYSELTLSDY